MYITAYRKHTFHMFYAFSGLLSGILRKEPSPPCLRGATGNKRAHPETPSLGGVFVRWWGRCVLVVRLCLPAFCLGSLGGLSDCGGHGWAF